MNEGSRVGFRWPLPEGTDFTDEAVASLVGKKANLSLLGEPVDRVVILEAHKVKPHDGGLTERPSLWIVVGPAPAEVEMTTEDIDPEVIGLIFNLGEPPSLS